MSDRLQIAVFTLKQVVKEKKTVTYVVHDNENNWQFLINEEVSTKDLMIISLGEMLEIDPTLESILWLPENMEAFREGIRVADKGLFRVNKRVCWFGANCVV